MGWGFTIPLLKVGRGRYSARATLTRRGIKGRARFGWFHWSTGTKRRRRRY